MAHIPESTTSADERPLDMMADPSTQGDDRDRKCVVVAQFRRVRSVTLKTVQQARGKLASAEQGTLLTEMHSMDEERRSLAELQILKGRDRR